MNVFVLFFVFIDKVWVVVVVVLWKLFNCLFFVKFVFVIFGTGIFDFLFVLHKWEFFWAHWMEVGLVGLIVHFCCCFCRCGCDLDSC